MRILLEKVKVHLNARLKEFLSWFKFFYHTLIDIRPVFRYREETIKQIYILGNQALPLVIFASMFITMVLTFEWGKKFEPFGAKVVLGRIVTMSVIREIGPIITGLMVAGRTGAKLVSEIGNMVLTQQIEALRAFGIDPVKRVVAPRVFASFIVMTPLTIIADTMGIIAGWFIAVTVSKIDPQFFWLSATNSLLMKDLLIGIIKPPFFGILIGLISGYIGYNISGGAEGMGRAATRTVMFASLGVLIMDFFLTTIIVSLF
jgi:phospholipid/cholesterol/gamma-HCH transport system permease protein